MNSLLNPQIQKLKSKYRSLVKEDGSVVFFSGEAKKEDIEVKIVFEDYFVTGFPGFDFHEKYNNGVYPYSKVMYGKVLKETEKMFYLRAHQEISERVWEGWCPKKSCTIYGER